MHCGSDHLPETLDAMEIPMPRLLVLAACLVCFPALAGKISEIDTQIASEAGKYSGYEHRASVNKAQALANEGADAAAWAALEPVLAYCEKERSIPDRVLVSVLSAPEEAEVRTSTDRTTALFFVDIACPCEQDRGLPCCAGTALRARLGILGPRSGSCLLFGLNQSLNAHTLSAA